MRNILDKSCRENQNTRFIQGDQKVSMHLITVL